MNTSTGWYKTRRRLAGVVFVVVFAVLIWLSIALYNKDFTPVVLVNLNTDTTGNELHLHAEVKVRGVDVGEVRQISTNGRIARLQLAIQPNMVPLIPDNVSAELLPTTLFGERYVDLILPKYPDPQRLGQGSTIDQDHSSSAIELEKVLKDLMPMLQAVQPQKLSVTLTAISQALQGRGTELGQTLVEINSYLQQMNPQLPAIDSDISQLVAVTNSYSQSFPDIVQAMSDFTKTSQTVVDEQNSLKTLYQTVTGTAQDLDSFLNANSEDIIRLSTDSRTTLQTLAKYSPEFPCVLQQLTAFEPEMDKVLGKGTSEPGLHVNLESVPTLGDGKYTAPANTPVFGDAGNPSCYSTPFQGIGLDDGGGSEVASTPQVAGSAQPTTSTANATDTAVGDRGGVGLTNTPAENEFINELLSPQLNVPPQQLPDWSSVLVGPLYRGTEVTLK
ncbi:MAG TPA: MCE family protein [Pseudonocardiaceae bacterium]|jgi:phospholipid/cholesterol/gamma-HCH transport system substrate-binding protein|nr:MCE family protein [Pseudonocardiaceae bacterium]